MDTSDQKTIFGILVGLAALFFLWLWASGNAAAVWAAATGSQTPASATTGSANTVTISAPTNAPTIGGMVNSLGGLGSATLQTVNVPNYASTLPAIQPASAESIGGNTASGAVSGGVSVTPTALLNSFSLPQEVSITPSPAIDTYTVPA